jgi:CheY-like chemotaxis protein
MAGSKKILFVEDDKNISDMYSRMLIKAGYQVEFAYNGAEGLDKALATTYDLILMDIMMPELTGIEVLQRLQEKNALTATKVVMLTNYAQDTTMHDALRAQADGYLIKTDVIPSKLLTLVTKLLS